MKKLIVLSVLFNLYSCKLEKVAIVECKLNDSKSSRVQLKIPKYKNLSVIKADAEEGIEYVFWYKDSSAVYISTFKGGPTVNYQNIRNKPSAYDKRFSSDSINLRGIDATGMIWREIKKHELYVGYFGVNPKNKLIFDQAIDGYVFK
jgi:hypothetical protein